jgi:hypothetical protein
MPFSNDAWGRFETSEKVSEFLIRIDFIEFRKTVGFSKHKKPPKWYNGC